MDVTSCVARRTRSRTEFYLVSQLRKSKGIMDDPVEDPPKEVKKRTTEKRRASIRDSPSPTPAKRRGRRPRRRTGKDDDVVFVGTNCSDGRRGSVDVEEKIGGSDSESSLGLDSKWVERNRVSDSVDDHNLSDDIGFCGNEVSEKRKGKSDEEKTSALSGSLVENSSSSKVIDLDSDEDGFLEEELGTDVGEHGEGTDSDDSDDEDDDESVETETLDCMDESSDLSNEEDSEDFEYICSEDEPAEPAAKNNHKSRKGSKKKVHGAEIWNEFLRTNSDVVNLLANSIRKKDKLLEESEDSSDELGTNQCTTEDLPPLNPNFGYEEPKPVEKTEEEKELDKLWDEMAFALTSDEIHSASPAENEDEEMDALGTKANPVILCSQGKHDLILDDEVGLKCCYCSHVAVEIRDISPAMDKNRAFHRDRTCSGEKDGSLFDGLEFQVSDGKDTLTPLNNTRGTVWDCIPGIKDTLYHHQQEGFEFIWKSLAGTTSLKELKSFETTDNGGCIISHSPGTGKTRLTIVFLTAYLEMFPDSHPVIIAPASLLLTWEEEFRKWNVNIPFYNMNSLEFSGIESTSALSTLKRNRRHRHNKNSIRMVKLFSWCKKKSILGVSYHLYEKLAGGKAALDKEPKKGMGQKLDREREELRKILLEMPGLLVLDEGHTPRNQRSCIWKAISQVQTEKRIILSGTPFQNNFQELKNILCLVRPANADVISSRLEKLCKWSNKSKKSKVEVAIEELRALMAPFVHVHKGNILKKSLPGLRDCVVVLNPRDLQEKILVRIDRKQNTFELEHKLSAVSVHPSLFLGCSATKNERHIISPLMLQKLERLKFNSEEGVKTRFLMEFIRFSDSMNEKVLVFSQYLDTLSLIMEQLSSLFGWAEGKEVLYMHGQLEQRQRQCMINNFNGPNSEAKVFLASTRACSEGINLVGASRVVLLDVVWNPSVERQAISRAYRLGQKRVVYTYHLVIKDTPECDKYCKQTEKHRISELVFSFTNEKDKLKSSLLESDDKILEEMISHDRLKDMFEKIIYQPKESDLVESFASVTSPP